MQAKVQLNFFWIQIAIVEYHKGSKPMWFYFCINIGKWKNRTYENRMWKHDKKTITIFHLWHATCVAIPRYENVQFFFASFNIVLKVLYPFHIFCYFLKAYLWARVRKVASFLGKFWRWLFFRKSNLLLIKRFNQPWKINKTRMLQLN
jgi:hypothetical protein